MTHLRGRWNKAIGKYDIDLPIDIDLPALAEDPDEMAEDLAGHLLTTPPENEKYLTLPADKIAFLGAVAEIPNVIHSIDVPHLLGDLLSSCDVLSLDELMEVDDKQGEVLGFGLKNNGVLLPLPADSFTDSIYLDIHRLRTESIFGKRFAGPLISAMEAGFRLVREENINRYVMNINQADLVSEFNRIIEDPRVLSNLSRIQGRYVDEL